MGEHWYSVYCCCLLIHFLNSPGELIKCVQLKTKAFLIVPTLWRNKVHAKLTDSSVTWLLPISDCVPPVGYKGMRHEVEIQSVRHLRTRLSKSRITKWPMACKENYKMWGINTNIRWYAIVVCSMSVFVIEKSRVHPRTYLHILYSTVLCLWMCVCAEAVA